VYWVCGYATLDPPTASMAPVLHLMDVVNVFVCAGAGECNGGGCSQATIAGCPSPASATVAVAATCDTLAAPTLPKSRAMTLLQTTTAATLHPVVLADRLHLGSSLPLVPPPDLQSGCSCE
jgi:hypothetical protein